MDRWMQNQNKIKTICGFMLLFISVLLEAAARHRPAFAEWYSVHIYPVLVNIIGRLSGMVSFSVVEWLLYVVIIGIIAGIAVVIWKMAVKKPGIDPLIRLFSNLFLGIAVLIFLYVINCGINYYRTSFAENIGLETERYSIEELKEVCQWLTGEVNDSSKDVARDEAGVMQLETNEADAVAAMHNLGEQYPEMKGYYPQPKGLFYSQILSLQNLTGVYCPFTIEANYNADMTDYNMPFTMCHELSHLRGFMQEEEANFIAFLACTETEEPDFQYSGYLEAWIYCMNVLYRVDYSAWEEVRAGLSEEVEADLKANHAFWASYDGTAAEVSNKINDTYLKANGQNDGVESYDRMVDLIVAYYN